MNNGTTVTGVRMAGLRTAGNRGDAGGDCDELRRLDTELLTPCLRSAPSPLDHKGSTSKAPWVDLNPAAHSGARSWFDADPLSADVVEAADFPCHVVAWLVEQRAGDAVSPTETANADP